MRAELEPSVASPVVQTLSGAAGKLVPTLGLRLPTAQLGSLVVSSVAVLLSVTLPAGRDTETVRTPGNTTNVITSQPACSSNHTLPHVSTPASVGGRRLILCRTVFLIAGISRQTITLAIAYPAGGDTVAILTAEPAMGTTGQLRCKNSQQNKVSELLTLAGSLQSRHSHQDSPAVNSDNPVQVRT